MNRIYSNVVWLMLGISLIFLDIINPFNMDEKYLSLFIGGTIGSGTYFVITGIVVFRKLNVNN